MNIADHSVAIPKDYQSDRSLYWYFSQQTVESVGTTHFTIIHPDWDATKFILGFYHHVYPHSVFQRDYKQDLIDSLTMREALCTQEIFASSWVKSKVLGCFIRDDKLNLLIKYHSFSDEEKVEYMLTLDT